MDHSSKHPERCENCGRGLLVVITKPVHIEIKCPKCGHINEIKLPAVTGKQS